MMESIQVSQTIYPLEMAWPSGPFEVIGERSLATGEIIATIGGPGGTADCRTIVIGYLPGAEPRPE